MLTYLFEVNYRHYNGHMIIENIRAATSDMAKELMLKKQGVAAINHVKQLKHTEKQGVN